MCQEVENKRKKTESSFDHGKGKAQAAYQQQLMEMRNVKVGETQILVPCKDACLQQKNTYLISINVTNRQVKQYYHEYLPELLDVRSRLFFQLLGFC